MTLAYAGPASFERLSKRQREIATLVAEGKSNRQIADELSVSERTVENHVAAIYSKLDVRSRVELTVVVVRHAYGTPPAALPIPLTSFLGRDRELAEVVALLDAQRLVNLVGLGGIGKTRLALQVGATIARTWPGGVLLVELSEARDARGVAAAFQAALGGAVEIEADAVGETPAYAPALALLRSRRKMLLVFDNCEQVCAAAADVVTRVLDECANVHVLATSRAPLGVAGEQMYRMRPLAVPDALERRGLSVARAREYAAVALFLDRAGSTDHRFSISDAQVPIVCEIVERLDGIALAIELAASWCSTLDVAEINRRLDRRFDLLTGGTAELQHQRTLRATIDWSFDLLSEEERLLRRRLVVFAGGFTAEAVEFVCTDEAVPRERVPALLRSLVAQSFLTVQFGSDVARYGCLETIRSYLLEVSCPPPERERLARRHAEWVLSLATPLAERRDRAAELVPALQGDLDNIRAAIAWALGPHGDVRLAGRIVAGLRDFWFAAGLHGETRRWTRTILDALGDERDAEIVAATWLTQASVNRGQQRVTAAERAAELFARRGDHEGLATSCFQQCWGHYERGTLDEALAACERSLRAYRDAGMQSTWLFAQALALRGGVRRLQRRFPEARADSERALRLFRLLRNEPAELWTRISLGEMAFAAGDPRAAIDAASDALVIAERHRAAAEATVLLSNRAGYHLALDEFTQARIDAVAALALARSFGFDSAIPIAMEYVAALSAHDDDPRRSALIAGYVDGVYHRDGAVREPTEAATHERLLADLRGRLPASEMDSLLKLGAQMSEAQAWAEVDALLGVSNA